MKMKHVIMKAAVVAAAIGAVIGAGTGIASAQDFPQEDYASTPLENSTVYPQDVGPQKFTTCWENGEPVNCLVPGGHAQGPVFGFGRGW